MIKDLPEQEERALEFQRGSTPAVIVKEVPSFRVFSESYKVCLKIFEIGFAQMTGCFATI